MHVLVTYYWRHNLKHVFLQNTMIRKPHSHWISLYLSVTNKVKKNLSDLKKNKQRTFWMWFTVFKRIYFHFQWHFSIFSILEVVLLLLFLTMLFASRKTLKMGRAAGWIATLWTWCNPSTLDYYFFTLQHVWLISAGIQGTLLMFYSKF